MSCCGRMKRPETAPGSSVQRVELTYVGHSTLTTIGPVTGRRYKFPARGAVLEVDAHDARVWIRAAHDGHVDHPGQRQVVDPSRPPA